MKPQYSGHLWAMKIDHYKEWPLYRGQNEWGKVLLVDTNVAFIKRWPSYRVTTIVRFHCIYKTFTERKGEVAKEVKWSCTKGM